MSAIPHIVTPLLIQSPPNQERKMARLVVFLALCFVACDALQPTRLAAARASERAIKSSLIELGLASSVRIHGRPQTSRHSQGYALGKAADIDWREIGLTQGLCVRSQTGQRRIFNIGLPYVAPVVASPSFPDLSSSVASVLYPSKAKDVVAEEPAVLPAPKRR